MYTRLLSRLMACFVLTLTVARVTSSATVAETGSGSAGFVSDDEFRRNVIEPSASRAIIVEFDADWCGPCRIQRPILDALALQHRGRIGFIRIDADLNSALEQRFHVSGLPTLLVFSDGLLVQRLRGQQTRTALDSIFVRYENR
jgi:thioredoxin 1